MYELSGKILLYSKEVKSTDLTIPDESGYGSRIVSGSFLWTVYFIKVNDELIRIGLRLKNKHLKYFEKCPILLDKIKNNEFKRNEVKQIVSFYNKSCE
ncbi:hypothetical protein A9Q86_08935 [Flavobacteriales bacterium 33_180_T64]|nr:hypothetical protein A9Q86_08935 [Flavobacteriales bacterium 33_180_T64]